MLVTSDITFQNIGGLYDIKHIEKANEHTSYIDVEKKNWPTDLSKYKEYAILPITDSRVVSIYPDSLRESRSPALEFAAIDILKVGEIIDFCNRYGLPSDPRFFAKNYNDYVFTEESLTESLLHASLDIPFNPHHEICMGLDDIVSEIIDIRNLISLISAYDERNYSVFTNYIIYYAFNDAKPNMRSTGSSLCGIYYNYRDAIPDVLGRCPTGINESILHFIEDVEQDTLETEEDPRYSGDYSYPQHKHLLWQNVFRFTKELLRTYKIVKFSSDKQVIFDRELNIDEVFSLNYNEEDFFKLARAVLIDTINCATDSLKPELVLVDGTLTPNWSLRSLKDAMYAEIFFKINPYNRIKKCANPTCNSYFTLSRDNSRKIYCSTSCAQLMAKRKQRTREKEKWQSKSPNPSSKIVGHA